MKKANSKTTQRATGGKGAGWAVAGPGRPSAPQDAQGQRDEATRPLPGPLAASMADGAGGLDDVGQMVAKFRALVRDLAASYQRGGMTEDAARAKAFEAGFESALTGWADCIRRSKERDKMERRYVESNEKLLEAYAKREELRARERAASEKLQAITETERDTWKEAAEQRNRPHSKKRGGTRQEYDVKAKAEWARRMGKASWGDGRRIAEEVMDKFKLPKADKDGKDMVESFRRSCQMYRRKQEKRKR